MVEATVDRIRVRDILPAMYRPRSRPWNQSFDTTQQSTNATYLATQASHVGSNVAFLVDPSQAGWQRKTTRFAHTGEWALSDAAGKAQLFPG